MKKRARFRKKSSSFLMISDFFSLCGFFVYPMVSQHYFCKMLSIQKVNSPFLRSFKDTKGTIPTENTKETQRAIFPVLHR